MKNKIYLISQNENNTLDTYDSAVVVAPDEETARKINPGSIGDNEELFMTEKEWAYKYNSWCSSEEKVTVKCLGDASKDQKIGVVCSSFNAG